MENFTFDITAELASLEGGNNIKAAKPTFQTYMDELRYKFVEAGKKQIDAIQTRDAKRNKYGRIFGSWFEEQVDGRFKVIFRNASQAMELTPGKTYYFVKGADEACQLIAKALVSAETGQLDKHLEIKNPEKKLKKSLVGAESYVDRLRRECKAKQQARIEEAATA